MELFTTFDDSGAILDLVPRQQVHERGFWHQSAQVFVFNSAGELLLARRAADKDLYANLWDYSVGEHLQPGETHLAAAYRGLVEELSISTIDLQPLGDVRWVEQKGEGFWDREIQQAFRGCYDARVVFNSDEVQAIQFIDLVALNKWVNERPDDFTPWLLTDLLDFELLSGH